MSPRHLNARPTLAPFAVASVLALSSPPAASQEEPGPAGKSLRLELPTVTTRVGEQFEVRLHAHTGTPLRIFALRVEAAPAQVRLRSWSFGEGLLNHITLHGEPPACDIVVYPDGSRMFAVMAMDPPFSSQDYGSECFVLRFNVEAESPGTTCILYSGDTPDYEPGDDLLTVISRLSPERRCAPVLITGAPAIRRGDADGDARRSITDAIHILDYLFLGCGSRTAPTQRMRVELAWKRTEPSTARPANTIRGPRSPQRDSSNRGMCGICLGPFRRAWRRILCDSYIYVV